MPFKGAIKTRLLVLVAACAAFGNLTYGDVDSNGLNLVRVSASGRSHFLVSCHFAVGRGSNQRASAGSRAQHKLFRISIDFKEWSHCVLC